MLTVRSLFRRSHFPFTIAAVLLAAVTTPGSAHEGNHDHPETGTDSATVSDDAIGEALILPAIVGPTPWSAKPALTDPQRFSIAIVTDRTGGHRPGIWMKAVERINWLRPDFVVSVGDLIEGYTEDKTEIERQWQEFLGFIDQLQMKFFFVAGNHDVTNPTMHKIWRQKFGKEWYSFDYKDVHFVCLLSEDPSARLGEEQLEWLEDDLEQHKDARWTLVFLHKPLWTYSERASAAGNEDRTNWKRAESMLAGRPHTIFAGHVHHYVQYQRNGQQYYSLATTGGGSRLRGLPYGEFDHITWLTMEQDGPRVVNLLLDGIQPADIVTEKSIERFREYLQQVRIEIDPIFISGKELSQGEIRLTIRNEFETPVSIDAVINGLPLVGLDMQSQSIQLEVEAGATVRHVVPFQMKEPVELARFKQTSLEAKVVSVEDTPLRAEWSVPVLIDREYEIRSTSAVVDGRLDDWDTQTWWATEEPPVLSGETNNWNGTDDASFMLSTSYDETNLYFAARVRDEKVIEGDQLTVAVDPRPLLGRLQRNRLGRETIALTVQAPDSEQPKPCSISRYRRDNTGLAAAGRLVPGGYELEFSVPIKDLVDAQRDDWATIQMGARLTDVDFAEEQPCEVLWRASPNRVENREFAHLIRK